ncbi:MAG: hypothetical protein MHMPM18_003500, partial [Marteilia pararefringens]
YEHSTDAALGVRYSTERGVHKYVEKVRGGIRDPNHHNLRRIEMVTRLLNVSPSNPRTMQISALKCLLYHIPGAQDE